MDWYLIVKFLHVTLAVAWVGGGVCLVILAILADRARDRTEFLAAMGGIVKIAPVVFIPASIAVLLSGLAMVWLGGLMWDAWLIIGLGGSATASAIGALGLGPLSARIISLSGEPGREVDFYAASRRFLRLAKFDYVVQFSTVFAMVVKPGWSDVAILTAMAVLIALAATLITAPAPEAEIA